LIEILYNPVFHALSTGDSHFAQGTNTVKYFDSEVSPFVGFPDDYTKGFEELHALLPEGRRILYAIPDTIGAHKGWEIKAQISGTQFLYPQNTEPQQPAFVPAPLNTSHVDEMIALTALTKPGPFDQRTIEFGHYHGIFADGKLVAMTGQRLHPEPFTEISAVCTHPDYLGRGYAAALLQHQLQIILSQGKQPFLHVRGDNERAIALYERLGFKQNNSMHFYFMKRL
jgi:ribosomal protein S18 acetylase RimI-like enzyme